MKGELKDAACCLQCLLLTYSKNALTRGPVLKTDGVKPAKHVITLNKGIIKCPCYGPVHTKGAELSQEILQLLASSENLLSVACKILHTVKNCAQIFELIHCFTVLSWIVLTIALVIFLENIT